MNSRPFFSIVVTAFLLPQVSFSQIIEKISFDKKDSADGYYLAIQPRSKNIKAVLLVLTSFLPPEGLLPETKLHNVAYVNDVLTVVVSAKQKLYADSTTVNRLNILLTDITKRFTADTSKFLLAGYGEAGNIALRYTEMTYENPSLYPLQPKAVFGIDTPVDLFGLWHWSEKQIKKNYWPGAVGDAKYYLDAMTKENGTIYSNPGKYKSLTPFNTAEETSGNEQYLKNIPVRLYYDMDIDWQLKNRRNGLYDTKIPDGSELISRLLLAGNKQAELMVSKQPGFRSDGTRSPNAISIVDEIECIQWIKRCLHIVDVRTFVPPYHLDVPAGWGTELFTLPPAFAPQIKYKGVEDLRFAAGWGDTKSAEHWTYGFLWWLEGNPVIDAGTLQFSLKLYYDGLVASNINSRNIPADKVIPTTATIKKIKTAAGDTETFNGSVNMLDYHTQQPILLNCIIHVKDSKTNNQSAIFFALSPQPFTHAVWQQLNKTGDSFVVKAP